MSIPSTTHEAICIVPGCPSMKSRHPHLEYYPIPQKKQEEWLTVINRQGLLEEIRGTNKLRNKYRVCSLHFDDSMINLHRTLSTNAIPAFNLPENSDSDNLFHNDKIVQTDESGSFEKSRLWELSEATFIQPQPLRAQKKNTKGIQTEQKDVSQAEMTIQCSLSTQASLVVTTTETIQNLTTKPNGDFENTLTELSVWLKTVKSDFKEKKSLFKKFASVLYFSCTPLYENIQTSLDLPMASTLLKLNIDISCAIDRPIVNFYLSQKLNLLSNKSKHCILFVDAIDIKPHVYYNITKDRFVGLQQNTHFVGESGVKATKAFFMMLRGIHDDWQQLVNCFFINERKTYLQSDSMDGTLKTLTNIGFQVKTIVMDPNPYVYKYAKDILKLTFEKPYITFESTEVHFMFEPRNLIIHLRNILLENDLINNNNKISWQYVKDLYLHKEKYKLSILPKLTKAHVFPDTQQKKDYKYASEIFSDEICSTLEFYISLSIIPRDALPTVRFIRSISFLIDIFSSSSVNHENELKCAFKMNKQQCSVLLYVQDLLKTISILSKDNESTITIDVFYCMLITIHSLILLNNSLKTVGISHFMTKRLHQNPIDNIKKIISNEFKGKVTAVKLLKILGNHFIRQLLIRDKKFYDIPNNLNKLCKRGKSIAASIAQLDKKPAHQSKRESQLLTTKSLNGDFDYQFILPEKRRITYLSAYLFYKCYKKHRCCEIDLEWSRMKSSDDLPWNDCLPLIMKGNLRKPTPTFQQIVFHFEQTFLTHFFRAKYKPVENLLYPLRATSYKYNRICKCFPVNYLLLLFIRHRIYSLLIYNRELSKRRPSDNMILDKMVN